MAIVNTTLGVTETEVYTSSGDTAITVIYVCNNGASTVTFDVYLVPSGDSAGSENQIYKEISLDAGDTYIIDSEKIFLSDQDKVVMIASDDDSLRCTVSSVGV